ncbi:MAG TPA: hypothetical protein VGW37_16020 [Terriglobia bacterium]|nr:hypothetical protein [Terriglobia bacterium]
MADSTSSTAARDGTPARSFASRLLGVFIEPGTTFEDIARKPDWISPLIVLVLVSFATVETMLPCRVFSRAGVRQTWTRPSWARWHNGPRASCAS